MSGAGEKEHRDLLFNGYVISVLQEKGYGNWCCWFHSVMKVFIPLHYTLQSLWWNILRDVCIFYSNTNWIKIYEVVTRVKTGMHKHIKTYPWDPWHLAQVTVYCKGCTQGQNPSRLNFTKARLGISTQMRPLVPSALQPADGAFFSWIIPIKWLPPLPPLPNFRCKAKL